MPAICWIGKKAVVTRQLVRGSRLKTCRTAGVVFHQHAS